MTQQFKTTDVLRLDVERETLPGEQVNLVKNASGALGGWGWLTPNAGQVLVRRTGVGEGFEFRIGASAPAHFTTEDLGPVAPGDYVAARWTNQPQFVSAPLQGFRLRFAFHDATGALVSSGPQTAFRTILGTGNNNVLVPAAVVPVGAVSVRLRCDFYKNIAQENPADNTYMRFTRAVVVQDDTAPDPATLSSTLTSAYFTDVLGATNEITVERSELDAGVLRATIYDPTVDPSQSTLVRPGHDVRLRALVAVDTWEDVATGDLTNGQVTYDPGHPDPNKRARTLLAAADAAADLGHKRPEGVATVAELPYVLEGCGVPWNCNGSGNQVDVANVVAVNDQASALDQVVLTRDSVLGYAWVDRSGVLQAWDRTAIPTAVAAVLDETVYTTGIVIDYDTDRCINSVAVTFLRYDPTTGETEEIPYGPYRDEESIRVWGVHGAEFKIQWAVEDEPAIEAMAAAILAANATPEVRVNEVTLILDTTAKVAAYALLDLYDLVTVSNTNAGLSETYRVTSIKHTITADRWALTLGFSVDGGVATPSYVPAPSRGAGGLTFTQQLRPLGEVTMFYGDLADVPAGWLALNGATYDPATYPRLFDHLGTATLPNFTDRFPIGAGTKSVGSSGGAATRTLVAANLPPHSHSVPLEYGANTTQTGAGVRVTDIDNQTGGTGTNATASTGNGPGASTPVDVLNPWRALWFIIRAV